MTQSFININRLAMPNELRYLLDTLNQNGPMAWSDLGRMCKEQSLNFAFAFENTLAFLEHTAVVKIDAKGLVTLHAETKCDALQTEAELNSFIIQRTFTYFRINNLSQQLVNRRIILSAGSILTVHADRIPPGFAFIRSFLLNLCIVEPNNQSEDRFIIAAPYYKIFQDELIKNDAPPIPLRQKPTFFISYAKKDEAYKIELQNHFSGLVNTNVIESWDGQAISPGEDWEEEVRSKLDKAQVVLFLASADFMASDYINDVEIKRTIERHNNKQVKIIPVILRPCDYTSLPIGKFQALPTGAKPISTWDNKDEAYLDIVKQIRKVLNKL